MTTDEQNGLRLGLAELERLYLECISSFAPPNPQFERDRIITHLPNRREVAYVLGFLSEGENEAALLLTLTAEMLESQPCIEVGHVLDEAWYYLRTSVDSAWQLDRDPPSIAAALAYLAIVLERRLAKIRLHDTVPPPAAKHIDGDERTVLKELRLRFGSVSAAS